MRPEVQSNDVALQLEPYSESSPLQPSNAPSSGPNLLPMHAPAAPAAAAGEMQPGESYVDYVKRVMGG